VWAPVWAPVWASVWAPVWAPVQLHVQLRLECGYKPWRGTMKYATKSRRKRKRYTCYTSEMIIWRRIAALPIPFASLLEYSQHEQPHTITDLHMYVQQYLINMVNAISQTNTQRYQIDLDAVM
jgi:hypothetical protein